MENLLKTQQEILRLPLTECENIFLYNSEKRTGEISEWQKTDMAFVFESRGKPAGDACNL
jgi:hypothetical protein